MIRYLVIVASSLDQLQESVNKELANGWNMLNGIYFVEGYYCKEMVKNEHKAEDLAKVHMSGN